MIPATVWRSFFSFNAYAQISSRALRQSLKETARLNAEKRGITDLRFQKWENGNGGPQVFLNPKAE